MSLPSLQDDVEKETVKGGDNMSVKGVNEGRERLLSSCPEQRGLTFLTQQIQLKQTKGSVVPGNECILCFV